MVFHSARARAWVSASLLVRRMVWVSARTKVRSPGLGAFTTGPVVVVGDRPGPLGQQGDRFAHDVGDGVAEGVLQSLVGEVLHEGVGEPGAVGAHQNPPRPGILGQLRQGLLQDGDVVGGGVGTRTRL
jgi:hypothetical protein